MSNGFFKLVNIPQGFGVKILAPTDGGEPVRIMELMNYLDNQRINYDMKALRAAIDKGENIVFPLGTQPCPACAENYTLTVAEDSMAAVVRFYPASETGQRMSLEEFRKDMLYRGIKFGIQEETLQKHFDSVGTYCTDLVAAQGKPPRHGTDAKIEYYFNTDLRAKPEVKEDGSVDFFNLNVINRCKKGEVLAKIIPADEGEPGTNILGTSLRPRDVKKVLFKYGRNIDLSEDRLTLSSQVDGHVALVDGNVFVSDVYTVENVDNATGNIDFIGSVQVNGNVSTNFSVKAGGDVIINGVVEGAYVEAGGNIIIARGMNGMARGRLKAGGNIVSKFIENSQVEAEGYVQTESILHSTVTAGTEVTVNGKRGFITGGHVQASDKIDVKTLGAVMGAATVVEVGVNPRLKAQYIQLQKEIGEIVNVIKNTQPTLTDFAAKKAKGARFNPDQLKHVKQMAELLEVKKKELIEKNEEIKPFQEIFSTEKKAEVIVHGEVYPGTTIVIGESSLNIQSTYRYCKFERVRGDVKMMAL